MLMLPSAGRVIQPIDLIEIFVCLLVCLLKLEWQHDHEQNAQKTHSFVCITLFLPLNAT